MKVLVVRNSAHAPEGAFGDWLRDQGHALEVVSGEALDAAAMEGAELVVLLGSPHGVYETGIGWIARQRALTAARLAARRPIIGVCFGAQMIAAAVGGDCARMADGRFFRGWFGMEEVRDPVFAGPWPRWHGDAITAPPDAEVIARDAGTVQFHPEATPDILKTWAERFTPAGVVDVAALEAESARWFPARAGARAALFGELVGRASRG